MRVTVILIVIDALGMIQRLGRKTGGIGNQRENRDYLDYSIIEIAQNTYKIPGDPRRFAVAPIKDHKFILVWKTCKLWCTRIIK